MFRTPKVAIITCYSDPDYVRARALRNALLAYDNLEVIVIKNKQRNILRYVEVVVDILKARLTQHPDAYLLTFRGYELIPLLQILAWPKPVIFDEFINLYEWVVEEHQKVRKGKLPAQLLNRWWSFVLKHCDVILTDTQAHADHSAALSRLPSSKYLPIPVGTDETLFTPKDHTAAKLRPFTVFYYGNMLPLHGLAYVLEAAELLKSHPGIVFQLVGGKEAMAKQAEQAKHNGAHVSYQKWVPFTELPERMRRAGICLGGPFGNTIQSQFVITGKTYQSLACGAPTIIGASQASGIFTDKVDSLIVLQGDATELAKAILWAYEHPKELDRIAQKGRLLFERRFSTNAIAEQLRPALRQALPKWD